MNNKKDYYCSAAQMGCENNLERQEGELQSRPRFDERNLSPKQEWG